MRSAQTEGSCGGQSPSSPTSRASRRLTNQGRHRGVRGDSEAQIKCLTSIHPSKPSPSIREQGRPSPTPPPAITSTPALRPRELLRRVDKGFLKTRQPVTAEEWRGCGSREPPTVHTYTQIVRVGLSTVRHEQGRWPASSWTMTALAGGLPRMMRPSPHQNYARGGYSLEGRSNSWCLLTISWSRKSCRSSILKR